MWIVVILGAVFVLLGILMIVNLIRDKKLCTYPVDAKVADVVITKRKGRGKATVRTAVLSIILKAKYIGLRTM